MSTHAGKRVRLGSGTTWALATQAVTLASTLVIGIVVARTLGPDGKGALSLVQQSVGVLLVFADLGIAMSAVYYISSGKVRAGTVLGNALVFALLAAVVFVLLAAGLGASGVDVFGLSRQYLVAATALFLSGLIASWIAAITTGIEGTRGAARLWFVASISTLVVVAGAWLQAWRDPLAVLTAMAIGNVFGIASALVPLGRAVVPIRASLTAFRRMVRYALRAYAGNSADFLHLRLDLLMLGWMAGASAAGIYSVALSMVELSSRVPSAIGAAIQAQASRFEHEAALDFSARAIRLTVLITIAVVVLLAAVMHIAIPLLFGAAFRPAVTLFYLLIPRACASALVWPVGGFQAARGHVYWRESTAAVAANAALNLAVIPAWGARGAALASGFSMIMLIALLLWRLTRDTQRGLAFFLVPTREDLQITLGALRSYAVAALGLLRR